MNEQKKISKKKILTRILILTACVLVIAAVTVTTIFAVNDWGAKDIQIDSGLTDPDGGNENTDGENGDPDDDNDDRQTSTDDTFALPVAVVDVVNGYEFGQDVTLGHWHFHTGLDFAATAGTSVLACLDGTVESVVKDDQLDGTTVTIVHDNGLKTVYSYIEAREGLKQGDTVKRGEVIGCVAEANGAEFLEGAHLHFEVIRNGKSEDPNDYMDISSK